jgi:mannosyl-3-phosphoglycerate synthase
MSVFLARILPIASGYAVEPMELISLFEDFGGVLPPADQKIVKQGIEIFQIESRNPHFHEERGGEHLQDMLHQGLSTVYHSPLCDEGTKEMIIRELLSQRALKLGEEPTKSRINPPLNKINIKNFVDFMAERLYRYSALK